MKPGDRAQFVWMQNAEPISLYCGDETDGEVAAGLRAGHRVAVCLRNQRGPRPSRRWRRRVIPTKT